MRHTTVFFLVVLFVLSTNTVWAIDYTGEGSNCSVPPFVRQGAPPNVLLDISIETPMQGAAHPDVKCGTRSSNYVINNPVADDYECTTDPTYITCRGTESGRPVSSCYDNSKDYYGYFETDKCYTYSGSGATGLFTPSGNATNHQCSGQWSGNFLNWATMTAIDCVRKAFTGGNRDVDTPTNTVLLRANQTLDVGHSWFPLKKLDTNPNLYTPYASTIYIVNRGMGFAVCSSAGCTVNLVSGYPSCSTGCTAVRTLRVQKVCNANSPDCMPYVVSGTTYYKPVGVLQRYADKMRFGLISYALGPVGSNNRAATNGGVIRSNMKWISYKVPKGLMYHNSSGTLVLCTTDGGCVNPEREINEDGTLVIDPDGASAPGDKSGVISNLNKFGYQQGYKSRDPISEMYYEAVRYFKGFSAPTDLYCRYDNGDPVGGASGTDTDDGFPVYCNRGGLNWRDPMIYRCQQNFIIALNDANPWLDKRVAGTFFTDTTYDTDHPDTDSPYHPTGYRDWGAPSDSDPALTTSPNSTEDWTNRVGQIEGLTSGRIGCVPSDCAIGDGCDITPSPDPPKTLENILGQVHGTCPWSPKRNSYYIAGLAYYAHTTDLRTGVGWKDMQNVTTYVIDSQEANTNMLVGRLNMLYLAAKYGGFVDRDGDNQPNLQSEWDKDGDGFPDTYFFASDPGTIGTHLQRAFGEILQKTSSGTAVSVLSTSAGGEGSLFQAFFNPTVYEDSNKISWVGYLNALWVDQYGNLREDTVKGPSYPGLVLNEDYIIQYALNGTGDTVVNRYEDANGNGRVDSGEYEDTISLDELAPIYDYGKTLAGTAASTRTIYTFADAGGDGQDTGNTERIAFTTTNAGTLQPYLNAADAAEATDIINFIRGGVVTNCRNRQIDGETWKLGDIVYSTPSVVGRPMGNYHLIYGDKTYLPFVRQYRDRETVVYVGANDGMLHAFSAGQYHEGDNPGTGGRIERGWYDGARRGTELWGYIPYSLLPHLRWLADPDYCHVYYVDLKTKVVDARIFPTSGDSDHPNGWGTVLIGAMRLGGTPIGGGPGTRTYRSAYFALDITKPDASDAYNYPKLLWEYWDDSAEALGYTYSYPAIIRRGAKNVAGDWYVIFGSGPSDFDGGGATTGKVYVLNLATGAFVTDFTITDTDVLGHPFFLSSPITIDKGLDNQVNVAYIGATYDDGSWKGKIFRINTDDNNPGVWSMSTFFSAPEPVTSIPTAALDPFGRLWLFWGSGRYFSDTDKADGTAQRLYGVWDPGGGPFTDGNLNNVTSINVHEGGYVDINGNGVYDSGTDMTFSQYLAEVRGQYRTGARYGWYLDITGGERFLTKPTILGNIVLYPTFDPNDDLCDYGGDSYLFALYYETGTAYMKSVMGIDTGYTITVSGVGRNLIVKKKFLGPGMPTSAVIHAGSQDGVKAMIQLGTGVVEEVEVDPAASPKSRVLYWREKGD